MVLDDYGLRETVQFWVGTALSVATTVVLIFTWRAAVKQAKAAVKLTEATEKQITASESQATAAKQQVEVARRQITEALRPILTFAILDLNGNGVVKNEGLGVALDIWYTYGSFKAPATVAKICTRSCTDSAGRAIDLRVWTGLDCKEGRTAYRI